MFTNAHTRVRAANLKGPPVLLTLKAYSVHLFTATGAVFAMLALLEAAKGDWAMMFLWLVVAFIVDGIDGPLARRYLRQEKRAGH